MLVFSVKHLKAERSEIHSTLWTEMHTQMGQHLDDYKFRQIKSGCKISRQVVSYI